MVQILLKWFEYEEKKLMKKHAEKVMKMWCLCFLVCSIAQYWNHLGLGILVRHMSQPWTWSSGSPPPSMLWVQLWDLQKAFDAVQGGRFVFYSFRRSKYFLMFADFYGLYWLSTPLQGTRLNWLLTRFLRLDIIVSSTYLHISSAYRLHWIHDPIVSITPTDPNTFGYPNLTVMMVSASNNTKPSVDYLKLTSSQPWDATGNESTNISRYAFQLFAVHCNNCVKCTVQVYMKVLLLLAYMLYLDCLNTMLTWIQIVIV